jgi:hypothetical protein
MPCISELGIDFDGLNTESNNIFPRVLSAASSMISASGCFDGRPVVSVSMTMASDARTSCAQVTASSCEPNQLWKLPIQSRWIATWPASSLTGQRQTKAAHHADASGFDIQSAFLQQRHDSIAPGLCFSYVLLDAFQFACQCSDHRKPGRQIGRSIAETLSNFGQRKSHSLRVND